MQQCILMICLDALLQIMTFHCVVEIPVQQLDSIVVSSAPPCVEEATWSATTFRPASGSCPHLMKCISEGEVPPCVVI